MKRAALRRLHSPDVHDLKTFVPPDPFRFGLLIQAMIGPEDEDGEESFDFFVCTPQWLNEELEHKQHVLGRHRLFVRRYDMLSIERVMKHLCSQAAGSDWSEISEFLSRYGKWEFEDYNRARDEDGCTS